jgi:ribulose-phosphate 3-epimerase
MKFGREQQCIVPAVIPRDVPALRTAIRRIAFAHEIQIDVVDGEFVPHTSWPYSPSGDPARQSHVWYGHTIEIDLMVSAPIPAAISWVDAGAEMLVFHIESITPAELASFRNNYPHVTIGVAALNDTPIESLTSFLPYADYVQVMGIAKIGAQGASFDRRAVTRIHHLRHERPDLRISVDGSMNPDTLTTVADAGADRFVVGSAILRATEPEHAFTELTKLVRPHSRLGNL